MSRIPSIQLELQEPTFDILVIVRDDNVAGKKQRISFELRQAIYEQFRKYCKTKKFKSIPIAFMFDRVITFVFEYPNPDYSKILSYRLFFGREGVIIEPTSLRPDPEVAPFLERVNLSKVENEFFNPADYIPRKRRVPSVAPSDFPQPAEVNEPAASVAPREARSLTAREGPTKSAAGKWPPYLCFGGQYLEKFGFIIGTPVTMVLEKEKITLTVAHDHH